MREFQAWIAQAIQAERAAQGITLKALARASGVPERTLIRALQCERDMTTEQLGKIAAAMNLAPSYLISEAERRRDMAQTVRPLSAADIAGFLAEPDSDPTLNTRLSEARAASGLTGNEWARLRERVIRLRRDELLALQGHANQTRNHHHGAS